ncbi:hypothetical protein [Nocardioides sp.]|uniref:hypothetical protein n=1 Tax=Nocardioides sp. TaxID=35761 RepID=UPI0035118F0C
MPELGDLLHERVDGVDVPRPDVHAIAQRGRRIQTRRRRTAGAVVAAAALVVGVGVAGLTATGEAPRSDSDPNRTDRIADTVPPVVDAAAQAAYSDLGVHSFAGTVHIGEATWRTDGVISHLAQTSAGVVVQHAGEDDEPRFTLVRPDGSSRALRLPDGVTHVDGDPTSPRIAWAILDDTTISVHVWDVEADREIWSDSQPNQGEKPDGQVIVAELDGDTVQVALAVRGLRVDWSFSQGRTTKVVFRDGVSMGARGGRTVVLLDRRWSVRDLETDAVVRDLGTTSMPPVLSPDGRSVLIPPAPGGSGATVIDVASGAVARLSDDAATVAAWTPGGRVVYRVDDFLERCEPDGRCEASDLDGFDPGQHNLLVGDYLQVG